MTWNFGYLKNNKNYFTWTSTWFLVGGDKSFGGVSN